MTTPSYRIEPLVLPSGMDGVPADSRAVKFALAAGYTLEQVTQFSALYLPVPDGAPDALEQEAGGAGIPASRGTTASGSAAGNRHVQGGGYSAWTQTRSL